MGGTRHRILRHPSPRRKKSGYEIAGVPRRGCDYSQTRELRENVHPGLQCPYIRLPLKHREIIARLVHLARHRTEPLHQTFRHRASHRGPRWKIERQQTLGSGHRQQPGPRLELHAHLAISQVLEQNMRRRQRRMPAQVYFDLRSKPAKIKTAPLGTTNAVSAK